MSRSPVVVPDLLRDAADTNPDGPALVDGDARWTYAELYARAGQVARLLTDLGVERGDRVGLLADHSAQTVLGMYGAMLAGAACVPVDTGAPQRRAAETLTDCGVSCLLSVTPRADGWAELVKQVPTLEHVVALDAPVTEAGEWACGTEALDTRDPEPPAVRLVDQDVAHILSTSGSTGRPKGVQTTHRSVLAVSDWAVHALGIGPGDRLSAQTPFHFQFAGLNQFAALRAAATLVVVPPRLSAFPVEIVRLIREQRLTVWTSVPTTLRSVAERGGLADGGLAEGGLAEGGLAEGGLAEGGLPSLRLVMFGGERFETKHLNALMRLLPNARFVNIYGTTEANVCAWYDIPPQDDVANRVGSSPRERSLQTGKDGLLPGRVGDDWLSAGTVPMGWSIDNDELYAVTEDGTAARAGEVGELYVRGATVTHGYWNDPDRTAQSLVPDPTGRTAGLAYRTGDRVRRDDDGVLHYVGRRDAQVKSRGYRIELGDVECALYAHPEVVECAVVAVPDEAITNRLEAHVVGAVSERELARFCGERIPRHMVPHRFRVRDALPKTSTGKVDRQALARNDA